MSYLIEEAIQLHSKPYPYQEEAIAAVLKTFQQHDRTHLVMACGTGKTRVSLWIAERMKAKRIVVFVPALALVKQLMEEWLQITRWKQVSCLAVCSDESVSRGTDSMVLNPSECDFPVSTDVLEVAQFLEKPLKQSIKIVFCTYHSAPILAEAMNGRSDFDFGVFDEAHKTSGDNYFGLAVLNKEIAIKKRLFMTATPRHYDVNRKNQQGYSKLIFSMDNELLYGPRAYTLSFRKAIELGIIVDYKVVVSVVESKIHLTDQTEMEEKMMALQKTIEQIPEISKAITFHHTIEKAYYFHEYIKKNTFFNEFQSYHISGILPSQTRSNIMRHFYQSKKSIITNARCLTEGIDAPSVDMVAFLNKKTSKIDIVQAIGRAMRRSPQKQCGYIFVPLFLEKNKNESVESAVDRSDFKEVWEVIQALSEQDQDLQQTINGLKQEGLDQESTADGLKKYLHFIFNNPIDLNLQKKLSEKISVRIIDKISSSWFEMLGRLQVFKEKNGHCDVPHLYHKDQKLGRWVHAQRNLHKNKKLDADRIINLESINFTWDPFGARWNQNYQKLLEFKNKNGHTNVPNGSSKDKTLKIWVNKQRQLYRKKQLDIDKIIKLESIGFEWDSLSACWNQNYQKLLKFKKEKGHCNISCDYFKDKTLWIWISRQRQLYRKKQLATDKISRLKEIGLELDPLDTRWDKNYQKLLAFKKKNGHCNVPSEYLEDKAFGTWVVWQRQSYKKNKLDADKIIQLNAIGFGWDFSTISASYWNKSYQKLLNFKKKEGHCQVPLQYPKDKQLGAWVNRQRWFYQKKRLSTDQIIQLEAIGFEWDPFGMAWEQSYQKLLAFRKKAGHCNVPNRYPEDKQLGAWVSRQKKSYRSNQLDSGKILKLEAIGFKWKNTH